MDIRFLTFEIRSQDGCRRAACGRHTRDSTPAQGGKKDNAITIPRAARANPYITKRGWQAAADLDLFQLAVREEADKVAIRRPERIGRAFRAFERFGFRTGKRAHPELHFAAGRRGEGQPVSVRRNSDMAETRVFWRQYRSLENARVHSRLAREVCPDCSRRYE